MKFFRSPAIALPEPDQYAHFEARACNQRASLFVNLNVFVACLYMRCHRMSLVSKIRLATQLFV